jgi:hypothetical protein
MVLAGLTTPVSAQSAPEAEAVWDRSCARCHRDAASEVAVVPGATQEEKRQWLDGFLATHRAPDPATRAVLIDWLLAQKAE